jgi:hypothetical protein
LHEGIHGPDARAAAAAGTSAGGRIFGTVSGWFSSAVCTPDNSGG